MSEAASPRIRKTMVFVLLALFLGQFGSGVYDLIFSNFLRDAQHLDVEMRGFIELPRELPGILSLFVVSLLFMFNEVRMAGVACLLMFGGMYALAFCGAGTSLWALSAWILTVSLGQHILMGMIDTIVIHTARPENRSLRLGQMKALGTAAALLGALCVWIKWKFNQSFAVDFFVTGGVCLLAFLFLSRVKTPVFPQRRGWRQCFVFKRRYAVYYGLEILHGIRKQLYLTFGFWLMVSTLGQPPGYIGKTLLIAGVIGLVTQPLIGWSIKRYGERKGRGRGDRLLRAGQPAVRPGHGPQHLCGPHLREAGGHHAEHLHRAGHQPCGFHHLRRAGRRDLDEYGRSAGGVPDRRPGYRRGRAGGAAHG